MWLMPSNIASAKKLNIKVNKKPPRCANTRTEITNVSCPTVAGEQLNNVFTQTAEGRAGSRSSLVERGNTYEYI